MPMRHPTAAERAHWDRLIAQDPAGGSVWQFDGYTEFKRPTWEPVRAVHELDDGTTIYATYLERRIPGFGPLWYASCGPRVASVEQLGAVCAQLRGLRRPFAVVMEPPLRADGPDTAAQLAAGIPGLVPTTPVQIVATHTVEIDLTGSEADLLASFKQRTRRSIRKSERDGVTITHVDDESAFDPMWVLFEAMLGRANLAVRPREYYQQQWAHYLRRGEGHFVFATPPGYEAPTAGAFLIAAEDVAVYKDGGSVRTADTNGVQYRVQWEAMRWAKQRGARVYDMFGAPPSWAVDDPGHQFHGLVQFKTGFAPIVDYVGAVALVQRPRVWRAWDRFGFRAYQKLLLRTRGEYLY